MMTGKIFREIFERFFMKNDLIYRKNVYNSLLNGMAMMGYQSRALNCVAECAAPLWTSKEDKL